MQPPIVPKVSYEGDSSNFDDYPESDWKSARTLDENELKLFEDFWFFFIWVIIGIAVVVFTYGRRGMEAIYYFLFKYLDHDSLRNHKKASCKF